MNSIKNLAIVGVAGFGLLAAACGGTQPATSTGSSASGTGSSTSASSGYGSAPAASPAPAQAAALVKAATVSVDGKQETVLVNAQGQTLYYFTPDKGGRVTCTGGCAQAWPPLKMTSGASTPAAPDGVSGSLNAVASPDGGAQLTFNGWPVYTYVGDTAPGQANGQGSGGKWFVVTSTTPQA